MATYRISNVAKEDLMRIYQFGHSKFGEVQATRYYNQFFDYFEIIASKPHAFEAVDFIKKGYRRCVCGSESIFYRIQNDVVEIMAIVGQQDTNLLFK